MLTSADSFNQQGWVHYNIPFSARQPVNVAVAAREEIGMVLNHQLDASCRLMCPHKSDRAVDTSNLGQTAVLIMTS